MRLEDCVPASVMGLKTEANLEVIEPWFMESLKVRGDVCEFGCYRGTLSIKLAYYLMALGGSGMGSGGFYYLGKTVWCYDTFDGFLPEHTYEDRFPRVWDYTDTAEAYEELDKWSRVLPLRVVRGDVRDTIRGRGPRHPLSFAWFDLDIDELMEAVRVEVWDRITGQTVIGVDDYGRPECPTVGVWADGIASSGAWERVGHDPEAFIAFYRRVG